MAFVKGKSGNPSGRPKVVAEVQELARAKSPEAMRTLAEVMADKTAPHAARVAAANSIIDRGYGKPAQTINATVKNVDPNTITDADLAAIVASGSGEATAKAKVNPSKLN